MTNYAAVQAALKARGFGDLGRSGPASNGVDGEWGALSQKQLNLFQAKQGIPLSIYPDAVTLTALGLPQGVVRGTDPEPIPAIWLPQAHLTGVTLHWTAGGHAFDAYDQRFYHFGISALPDGSAALVRGVNLAYNDKDHFDYARYAPHTLNCNSGRIGISMACMGGAGVQDTPFVTGPFPMLESQWDLMIRAVAQLCRTYGIPARRGSVDSHAEIERNLGIPQRGKWDFTRLSFERSTWSNAGSPADRAQAIGDRARAAILALI